MLGFMLISGIHGLALKFLLQWSSRCQTLSCSPRFRFTESQQYRLLMFQFTNGGESINLEGRHSENYPGERRD